MTKKKESTFFQQQNYDRKKIGFMSLEVSLKIAFFHILGAPSIVSQKLHGTLLLLRMYITDKISLMNKRKSHAADGK